MTLENAIKYFRKRVNKVSDTEAVDTMDMQILLWLSELQTYREENEEE